MTDDSPTFNRGAIRPMQCMSEAWQLIKERYWFFTGLTFVGVLIAGMGPLGILTGPMMCGLFLCLFQHANNREVTFNTLFKGFDFFLPSFIATLLMMAPGISATPSATRARGETMAPGWTAFAAGNPMAFSS